MWLACWDGRDKAALLLLSKGADPNKAAKVVVEYEDQDIQWAKGIQLGPWTVGPLSYAVSRGSTKVVRSLLSNGARQDLDTGEEELLRSPNNHNPTPRIALFVRPSVTKFRQHHICMSDWQPQGLPWSPVYVFWQPLPPVF